MKTEPVPFKIEFTTKKWSPVGKQIPTLTLTLPLFSVSSVREDTSTQQEIAKYYARHTGIDLRKLVVRRHFLVGEANAVAIMVDGEHFDSARIYEGRRRMSAREKRIAAQCRKERQRLKAKAKASPQGRIRFMGNKKIDAVECIPLSFIDFRDLCPGVGKPAARDSNPDRDDPKRHTRCPQCRVHPGDHPMLDGVDDHMRDIPRRGLR